MGPTNDFYRIKVDYCSSPWGDQFRIFICPKWWIGEWEIVAQSRSIELENCNGKGIFHSGNLYRLVSVYIELSILWWVRLLARRLSFVRARRGYKSQARTKLDRLELVCERTTCVHEYRTKIGSRNLLNFFEIKSQSCYELIKFVF